MPEFEELRLVVNLTDNATAGLRVLNQELARFGVSAAKPAVQKMTDVGAVVRALKAEMVQVGGGTRDALRDISNFNRGIVQAGESVGLLGRTVFGGLLLGLPALIAGINVGLASFSRNMLDLRNNARMGGILPDEFKNITKQIESLGFTSDEASTTFSKFLRTVREASHAGTPESIKLFMEGGGTPAL